jgi:cytochrome c oxidase subunit 3
MLFASLFSGYVMLRAGSSDWPAHFAGFPWLETLLLAAASLAIGRSRARLFASSVFAVAFVTMKVLSDVALIGKGMTPASSVFLACWFTLTGVHALHVLAGAVATGWFSGPGARVATSDAERWSSRIAVVRRYWLFVDVIWLLLVLAFYVF